MTHTTIVTGATAALREAAILATLDTSPTAIIIEGLPDGKAPLALTTLPAVHISRIAPGCLCCTGNLVMRVTLNRLLRQHPARLFIAVASDTHLAALRDFLAAPPYDRLLTLTSDINIA